jgi:hypothetical protein
MRPQRIRRIKQGAVLAAVLVGLALGEASKASACDPGQYYDRSHQICQGTPPAYPRYDQPPTNRPYLGGPR